ncbi:msr3582 [Mesorhizobium japonicum MAFF 303099]|uniref:Msr3582 protein n=1 Tax=Mesorhizobium japonicum (strain LMG 29417 / CECT 9101 / MAFF 303099) TaxID=266835 RepID=Q98FX2_RHILO|nr:msr3582 [Mesorhizobium japonicum MAFF 303099]
MLFTLCDANMAKCLTITIPKPRRNCKTPGTIAKHQAEAGCSNNEWNHHANPEPRR